MAFSLDSGLRGFKHRLTKMYQDTKNLYDFTEPPKKSVSEAPELSSLHRKLRIQKDRLIAWGLQWSDKSGAGEKGQPADIDESLDKAGLGDVVGSVLATIKEIIAEADPLWQSSRAVVGGGGDEKLSAGLSRIAAEKMVERRPPFVQWDRARFEGLVHDLTISIDTLYDISKNRQRPSKSRSDSSKKNKMGAISSPVEKTTRTSQFEPSRMQTPQQINPSVLILPNGKPLVRNVAAGEQDLDTRRIVYMRREHTSNNSWKRDGGIPIVPVLLEYAAFDPIFASTGIAPPMERFEKLFAGLRNSQNTSQQEFHVPKLIGYFEDLDEARFGLIYELPHEFGSVDQLELDVNFQSPMISTVSDLLGSDISPPALEGRFRLAYNLATTMFKLQAKDIIHGNVASDNVLFFHEGTPHSNVSSNYDIRQPFLTNFDLFSVTENGDLSSYREYIEVQQSSDANIKENAEAMDLRGLAFLLLEIGLWTPIGQIKAEWWTSSSTGKPKVTDSDFLAASEICTHLAAQCGTLYMKAVQSCWQAGNLDMIQSSQRDPGLQVKMYWKVVKALEKCCAIDEDFEPEGIDPDTFPSEVFTSSGEAAEQSYKLRSASSNLKTADKSTVGSKIGSFRDFQPNDDIKFPETPSDFRYEDDDLLDSFGDPELVDRAPRSSQTVQYNTVMVSLPDPQPDRREPFGNKEHWARLRTGLPTAQKSREDVSEASQSTPMTEEKKALHERSLGPSRFSVGGLTHSRIEKDVLAKAIVPSPKRKLRIFPTTNIPQQYWDAWHDELMPRINHLLRGFYRTHPESVEISLVNMGETPQKTRPTILAICTSVNQVKGILKKSFSYDKSVFDLKVCKGKILRSRKNRPPNRSIADPLTIDELPAANTKHQVHPRFGASIGACVEGRHLPPVSLGGILEIDGVVYGMSVHHMLDDDDDLDNIDHDEAKNPHRSMGYSADSDSEGAFYYSSDDIAQSGEESESPYEYETEDESSTTESPGPLEPGDKEGIPVDCGEGYYVTQPAIDDVADEFFSSPDERDEEHLDCHGLGEMYASSGIRRTNTNGQTHEIDWALFTFNNDRLPPPTLIQEGQRRFCKSKSYPTGIVPCSELRNLQVHCTGRSSGLRAGQISSGMTSVKIYGRKTPSQSYEVYCTEKQGNMLGIPGDSGAWVIDNETGRACGSVLAWSQRKRVAYICPMDVLVEDIAKTVEAGRISLGSGGDILVDRTKREDSLTAQPTREVEGVRFKDMEAEWKSEMGMKGELQRRKPTTPVLPNKPNSYPPRHANDSDEERDDHDHDADADDEEEEYENSATDTDNDDTKTIRNKNTKNKNNISAYQRNLPTTTPTAPIRLYNNNNNNNNNNPNLRHHGPTKERDTHSTLLPTISKLRMSNTDGTGMVAKQIQIAESVN